MQPGRDLASRLRNLSLSLIAPVTLSLFVTAALAHARLKNAYPRAGATVTASPNEIWLQFSERIEPKFSGVTHTYGGDTVPTGPAAIDPNDKTTLIVPVSTPLAIGVYDVNWHAVSADTHKTEGSFTFEVRQ
jgi:methionine-rich copper-binding protein CopC